MNQNDQMQKHILDLYNAVSKACGDDEKAVKATIKSQGGDYKAIKQALAHVNETPKNEHDSDDVLKRAPLVRLTDGEIDKLDCVEIEYGFYGEYLD